MKRKLLFFVMSFLLVFLLVGCSGSKAEATVWHSGNDKPDSSVKANVGDFYLDVDDGDIYQFTNEGWVLLVNIKGKDGAQGPQGPQGEPGKDGADGKDGQDGKDGADGKDGVDGKDGQDGKDGADGKNGLNGASGAAGQKGDTGEAGAPGADGKGISDVQVSIEYDSDGGMWYVFTITYTDKTSTTVRCYADPKAVAVESNGVDVTSRLNNDNTLSEAIDGTKDDNKLEIQEESKTKFNAKLQAGTKLEEGTTELKLEVKPNAKFDTGSVALKAGEVVSSFDIDIPGIAEDNEKLIEVRLYGVLNELDASEQYTLYHAGVKLNRIEETQSDSIEKAWEKALKGNEECYKIEKDETRGLVLTLAVKHFSNFTIVSAQRVAAIVTVAQEKETVQKYYASLEDAVKAANEKSEATIVKLLVDSEGKGLVIKSDNLTIDLGGKTYTIKETVGDTNPEHLGVQVNGKTDRFSGTVIIKNGTIKADKVTDLAYLLQIYCNLELNNVKLNVVFKDDVAEGHAVRVNNGTTTLSGTTSVSAEATQKASATVKNVAYAITCTFSKAWNETKCLTAKVVVNTSGSIIGNLKFDKIPAKSDFTGNTAEADWEAADNVDFNPYPTEAEKTAEGKSDAKKSLFYLKNPVKGHEFKIVKGYFSDFAKAVELAVNAAPVADNGAIVGLAVNVNDGSGIFVQEKIFNDVNKPLTLDLNGKTYTVVKDAVGSKGTESQCLHLEADNHIFIKNGTIDANPATITGTTKENLKMFINSYCDLTLENVTLDGRNLVDSAVDQVVLSVNGGETTVKNCVLQAAAEGVALRLCYMDNTLSNTIKAKVENTQINGLIQYGKTFDLTAQQQKDRGWYSQVQLALRNISGNFDFEILEDKDDKGETRNPSIAINDYNTEYDKPFPAIADTKGSNKVTTTTAGKDTVSEYAFRLDFDGISMCFDKIDDAIAAVNDGGTIVLCKDTEQEGVKIEKSLTLDLNKNKYTGKYPGVSNKTTQLNQVFRIGNELLSSDGDENIKVTIKNGEINVSATNATKVEQNKITDALVFIIQNYADLTLDGVTLDGTNLIPGLNTGNSYALSVNQGHVVINNSTIKASAQKVPASAQSKGYASDDVKEHPYALDVCYFDNCRDVLVEVSGSTINGTISYSFGLTNNYQTTHVENVEVWKEWYKHVQLTLTDMKKVLQDGSNVYPFTIKIMVDASDVAKGYGITCEEANITIQNKHLDHNLDDDDVCTQCGEDLSESEDA